MYITKISDGQVLALPAEEIPLSKLRHLNSGLVERIVKTLEGREMYPKQIAHELGEHEQKIYYHVRHLEKAGILVPTRTERITGAYARYYKLTNKGFFLRFGNFELLPRGLSFSSGNGFLSPFIEGGQLNSLVVVGSPDPHGPDKARSRDGYYGIDLGLFLGTFLNYTPKPNVRLDTELSEDELKRNLILIGGPVVNKTTEKINPHMPVRFERAETLTIFSTITQTKYPGDEIGLIVKAKNPFNPDASVLVVAGKRHSGTRAAIIALITQFDELKKGNRFNPSITARVVEGLDLDSDGIIDQAEFRE